jgi:hypothetical protein
MSDAYLKSCFDKVGLLMALVWDVGMCGFEVDAIGRVQAI